MRMGAVVLSSGQAPACFLTQWFLLQQLLPLQCLQHTFRSAPKIGPQSDFSFIAFADMGQSDKGHKSPGAGETAEAVAQEVSRHPVDLVIHGTDHVSQHASCTFQHSPFNTSHVFGLASKITGCPSSYPSLPHALCLQACRMPSVCKPVACPLFASLPHALFASLSHALFPSLPHALCLQAQYSVAYDSMQPIHAMDGIHFPQSHQ